jgi:hypothetical protein
VDLGVRRVGELLGHEAVVFANQVLGELDRLVHAPEGRRLVDLGAVGAKQSGALAAHPLRQGEDQAVVTGRADQRQGDPGVAAGRLDDHRAPALDQAIALGAVDHRNPDPVLDRAAGVEVLDLGDDLAGDVGPQAWQGDERRVADHRGGLRPHPQSGHRRFHRPKVLEAGQLSGD